MVNYFSMTRADYDALFAEPSEPINSLKFSSDDNFTLSAPKKWDGTLEYTNDNGNTWTEWDGSELSGIANKPIYLRGIGNSKITGGYYNWRFTGKYCIGNIENLLDYQTVANNEHPTMGANCYYRMFQNCTTLITVPELPATILSAYCYYGMFEGCTNLTTAPELPATTLADSCYCYMFKDCTSITTLPELIATTLIKICYSSMFQGCTAIKLSTTQTDEYKYAYRIPTEGNGTTASHALDDMFKNTGGTFKGTPSINTTYYTDHGPVSANI